MANPSIPLRVHYLNVQARRPLTDAIAAGVELLAPYAERIERCDVHVSCWVQHHDVSRSYRVTVELEPSAGAFPISVDCESALNPGRGVLSELVRETFSRAARRLAAREQYAAYSERPALSPEARRLHPLHGLAPEERQYGGDER